MIKRSGAFLLTILYTVTVVGFALNLHYCFSHITAVDVNSPAKSCSMQMPGKMKCCQDKHFEVKVKDVHEASSQSFLSKLFGFELSKLPLINFFFSSQEDSSGNDLKKDPPDPPTNNPITFLKNCVFRI